MGGFLGIGGSAVKTDRSNELAGFGDLSNLVSTGGNAYKTSSTAGNDTISSALQGLGLSGDYFKNLLSGNRQQTAQAVAPTTNAVNAQGDALRRQELERTTDRGGGVAGQAQDASTQRMAVTDNAINAVRPAAATGLEEVSSKEGALGTAQMSEALQALGLSNDAAKSLTDIASGSRTTSNAINQQTQQQVGQLVGSLMLGLS